MRIPSLKIKSTANMIADPHVELIRDMRNNPRNRQLVGLYRKQHGLCEVCLTETKINPTDEIHHIVPLPSGTFAFSNLLAVCRECHERLQKDMTPEEQVQKYKNQKKD